MSSGPDPVKGPGDVERDEKCVETTDRASLAPSTEGMTGDWGLLDAEDSLLLEITAWAASRVPSVSESLRAGVVAFMGEPFPVGGVPKKQNF